MSHPNPNGLVVNWNVTSLPSPACATEITPEGLIILLSIVSNADLRPAGSCSVTFHRIGTLRPPPTTRVSSTSVPTRVGPSVTMRRLSICGCHSGCLLRSSRYAKTSSGGRLMLTLFVMVAMTRILCGRLRS